MVVDARYNQPLSDFIDFEQGAAHRRPGAHEKRELGRNLFERHVGQGFDRYNDARGDLAETLGDPVCRSPREVRIRRIIDQSKPRGPKWLRKCRPGAAPGKLSRRCGRNCSRASRTPSVDGHLRKWPPLQTAQGGVGRTIAGPLEKIVQERAEKLVDSGRASRWSGLGAEVEKAVQAAARTSVTVPPREVSERSAGEMIEEPEGPRNRIGRSSRGRSLISSTAKLVDLTRRRQRRERPEILEAAAG